MCRQVRGRTRDEPWSLVDFGLDLTVLKLYLDSCMQRNGMIKFLFKTKKITFSRCEKSQDSPLCVVVVVVVVF